jgi:hypothetical protein
MYFLCSVLNGHMFLKTDVCFSNYNNIKYVEW